MQAYWNMLEWKRTQLEKEEKDQKVVQAARATLTQRIRHIQLDLRDLMSQVSSQVSTVFLLKSTHISSPFPFQGDFGGSDTKTGLTKFVLLLHQMSSMRSSWIRPASATAQTPLNPASRSGIIWESRVEGYIILRDLDLYLTKLARDFLLLASKIQS